MSPRDISYQAEAKERLHPPHEPLSDQKIRICKGVEAANLNWKGTTLIERFALAIEDGTTVKAW